MAAFTPNWAHALGRSERAEKNSSHILKGKLLKMLDEAINPSVDNLLQETGRFDHEG
jgi:hypothetical protein